MKIIVACRLEFFLRGFAFRPRQDLLQWAVDLGWGLLDRERIHFDKVIGIASVGMNL